MTAHLLRAALKLADRGLRVFPCRPRDKRPATVHGVKDAITDSGVIERWWRQEPNFNIGVATGAVSDIMVVDVDDLDAEAELKKLEIMHGALPTTVESVTARAAGIYFSNGRSTTSVIPPASLRPASTCVRTAAMSWCRRARTHQAGAIAGPSTAPAALLPPQSGCLP